MKAKSLLVTFIVFHLHREGRPNVIKYLVCLLRFLSFVHIRHKVTIEIRSLRVSAIATSFQVEHVLFNFHKWKSIVCLITCHKAVSYVPNN